MMVYRNADIHREFFATGCKNGLEDILPDKMFYLAAIGSPDPIAAIDA